MDLRHQDEIVVVCRPCTLCSREPAQVVVPRRAYEAYQAGASIQASWPEAPADVRELLITGIHADCWERAFAPED